MDRKDIFFKSNNFDNLKETQNLEYLIKKLVEIFENDGFEFYPEWRNKHSSGKRRNFTFKVIQESGKEVNLITIYPKSGWLKVEVYRGIYNKNHYSVNIDTIDDKNAMKALLKDVKKIYNTISTFKI